MASERFMRKHYGASGYMEKGDPIKEACETTPEYHISLEKGPPESATEIYMVVCDEGWKQSIVCTGMYRWAAEWLVRQVQGKPFGSN